MAAALMPPDGFVLDPEHSLPDGFVMDAPAQPKPEPAWNEKLAEGAGAVLDPLMHMGSAMIAKPIADLGGLAAIPLHAAGLIKDSPTSVQQTVQNAMTYQPRTQAGASPSNPLNAIPQAISGAIDAIRPPPAQNPSSIEGMSQNAIREAIPQAIGIAGLKYGPKAAGAATEGLGTAAQEIAGVTTGAGGESLKLAYKAGQKSDPVFISNLRGEVPVEQVLVEAKDGLHEMQDAMSASYKDAKSGWAADKTKLNFQPIDDAFNKLERSVQENGHSTIGKAERAKIDEVRDTLDEWRNDPTAHTTVGLDALKRRIDAIYPDGFAQKQAQRVITGTRNAVKNAIVKQAPDYANAMSDYESQMTTIRDIEKSLSLGDKVAKDTAIRKLQSLMRNNVQTGYGQRMALADQLEAEGGVNLRPALAGQALASLAPRGLARVPAGAAAVASMTSPGALAALPFTSPRLMGELFYGAGKASNALSPLKDYAKMANAGLSAQAALGGKR